MSVWVRTLAVYEIDTWRGTNKIKSIVRSTMKSAPQITGSDGNANIFINFPPGYDYIRYATDGRLFKYQTRFYITIIGDLRNCHKAGVRENLDQFEKFIISQGWEIRRKSIEIGED